MLLELMIISLSIAIIVMMVILFRKLNTISDDVSQAVDLIKDKHVPELVQNLSDIGLDKIKSVTQLCGKQIGPITIPC